MTIGDLVRSRPVPVLYGLMFISLIALLPLPPLLQNQDYHQFADQRELFGIPNFWNVVSNLPFIAIGAAGLLRFHHNAISLVLFTGIFLTGFGSSYYHLDPNDSTLFWDRLPMTLCCNSIRCRRGAGRRTGRSDVVAAPVGDRHFQSFVLALDRRFAALCLGAVFSFCCPCSDTPILSAEIYRHFLLGGGGHALRARQAAGIL